MATNTRSGRRKRPSFIEKARREQIIEATIDTVFQKGFVNTSLSEIAKTADISKTIIPYYFGHKDDLLEETLKTLYARQDEYIKNSIRPRDSALDKLRSYVTAHIEYARAHRREIVADWELLSSFETTEAKRRFNKTMYNPIRQFMSEIIAQGQETGEIGNLIPTVAASVILGAIDGIVLQWTWDEDAVDLDQCQLTLLDMLNRLFADK